MNITQLRYFISVAECRSFTKAAKKNYVTQTAISQQIKALEEQLGVRLIDRTERPVGLTSAGEVFYTEAKALVQQAEDAVRKTRNVENTENRE